MLLTKANYCRLKGNELTSIDVWYILISIPGFMLYQYPFIIKWQQWLKMGKNDVEKRTTIKVAFER